MRASERRVTSRPPTLWFSAGADPFSDGYRNFSEPEDPDADTESIRVGLASAYQSGSVSNMPAATGAVELDYARGKGEIRIAWDTVPALQGVLEQLARGGGDTANRRRRGVRLGGHRRGWRRGASRTTPRSSRRPPRHFSSLPAGDRRTVKLLQLSGETPRSWSGRSTRIVSRSAHRRNARATRGHPVEGSRSSNPSPRPRSAGFGRPQRPTHLSARLAMSGLADGVGASRFSPSTISTNTKPWWDTSPIPSLKKKPAKAGFNGRRTAFCFVENST